MEILSQLKEKLRERDYKGIRGVVASREYREYKEGLLKDTSGTKDAVGGLEKAFEVLEDEETSYDLMVLRGCITQIECHENRVQVA